MLYERTLMTKLLELHVTEANEAWKHARSGRHINQSNNQLVFQFYEHTYTSSPSTVKDSFDMWNCTES